MDIIKWRALWPLWVVEMTLYVCLVFCYSAWAAIGWSAAGPLAVVLAVYFIGLECMQVVAVSKPLFGKEDQLMEHMTDIYNFVDVTALVLVCVTVFMGAVSTATKNGADANAAGATSTNYGSGNEVAVALTVLMLFLKLITMLRAISAFGFLVSMMFSIISLIIPFLCLLVILVLGFATSFKVLPEWPGPSRT